MFNNFWTDLALLYPLYPDKTKRQIRSGIKIGLTIVFFFFIALVVFCSYEGRQMRLEADAKARSNPYYGQPAVPADVAYRAIEKAQREQDMKDLNKLINTPVHAH